MNILANFASPTQWFILVIVCLVVFGAKRLPDIARNVGKGLVEFKKARKEIEDELLGEDEPVVKKTVTDAPAAAPAEEKKDDTPTV